MKILLISDEESKYYWDYYKPGKLDGIDLILSCGDLKREYLEFLVTMGKAPVFYVPGNHDDRYETEPPEGCVNIDGRIVEFNGLRIAGFGGCLRYNPAGVQYTERQMSRRVFRLRLKITPRRPVDIVLTHAPILGVGDGADRAHRGFKCFAGLVSHTRPKYFIHGHVHTGYSANAARVRRFEDTTVINACERYILEIPDEELSGRK